LSAGKHVLSEKPVAKDLATAHELIDWYHKNIDTKKTIWAVAENFRYLGRFQYGAEQVQQLGDILGFRLRMHAMVKPGAKYYETEWRKTPEYQVSLHIVSRFEVMMLKHILTGRLPSRRWCPFHRRYETTARSRS
jgi:predicted dehydrogenase